MMYKKRPKNAQKPSSVYLQREAATSIYKIGVAADVDRRLKQNQTGNSSPLSNANIFKFKSKARAHDFEGALHRIFKPQHVRGEFYRLDSADLKLIASLHAVARGEKSADRLAKYIENTVFKYLFLALLLLHLVGACS